MVFVHAPHAWQPPAGYAVPDTVPVSSDRT